MRLSGLNIALVGTAIFLIYGAVCIYVRTKHQEAFSGISIGDTADSVLARFGNPSVKELPGKPFTRYASTECRTPCVERFWFENRLAFDLEAWSVSLGSDGKVVEKYHWV